MVPNPKEITFPEPRNDRHRTFCDTVIIVSKGDGRNTARKEKKIAKYTLSRQKEEF
jgi:hypothetical protein